MAERAYINQVVRLAPESTPGVIPASGFRQLQGLMGDYGPDGEVRWYKGIGQKYPVVAAPNKEWSVLALKGQPTYTELPYLLCGVWQNVTPTLTGTNVRTWTFNPATSGADTIKTYAMEAGETGEVEKAAFMHVVDFGMKADRDGGVETDAALVGRRLDVTAGNTFGTLNGTALAMVPMLPTHLNVYLDATSGGLGTTQLLRAFLTSFALKKRQGQVWAFNRSEASFAAIAEDEPDFEMSLLVHASNTAGQGGKPLFTQMRAGTKMYIRLEWLSSEFIETVTSVDYYHKFTFDAAVTLGVPKKFTKKGVVMSMEWPMKVTHDAAWGSGKAYSAVLVNNVASL